MRAPALAWLLWPLLLSLPAAADPAARPQLAAAAAATQRLEDYLDQGPSPWRPPPADAWLQAPADFVVAADGSGSHRTLQSAIDALPAAAAADGRRRVIRIRPGVYREIVCAQGKAPFALVGDADEPSAVRIVEGRWAAQRKRPGVDPANPCDPALEAASYGTAGSTSVALFTDDVVLARLTIANDALDGVRFGQGYPEGAGESGGAQGVALMTRGDRIQMDRVRLIGHQDTLYVRAPAPGAAARVLVQRSLIAGDVDFIFGDGTLVVHDSHIVSRGGRRMPGNGGHVLAPSTAPGVRLGFLVSHSRLLAEPGVAPGSVSLGRAWDFGVPRGQWKPGVSPNGQALVRDSVVGGHIGPWATSTSRRPFSATGEAANRMAEHGNRLLDADPARAVLPVEAGWAAAGMGTWGGALAAPADVLTVATRAELAAALAGPPRPRIVKLAARIDLARADDGRALGPEDWRDAGFGWDAYARAYDPATWGRRAPEGALEEARRRSAARQAAQVLLRVPSDTTLIGVEVDAGIVNGGLVLDGVHNVVLRHLHFSDAHDHFPAWDPGDNRQGEWNAQYDNLQLRDARQVWIDHCRFDDGARPDAAGPRIFERPLMRHDGLVDITHRSDFVTLSWNVFDGHDKVMLIGGSDRHRDDEGRLRVTLQHNLWQRVRERTPRVRFGRVHVLNNLFVGEVEGPQALNYSIGLGLGARIVSEGNVWITPDALPARRLLRPWGGRHFADLGSWHNGRPVDLAALLRDGGVAVEPPGWTPTLVHERDAVESVAARVRAGAGPWRGLTPVNR